MLLDLVTEVKTEVGLEAALRTDPAEAARAEREIELAKGRVRELETLVREFEKLYGAEVADQIQRLTVERDMAHRGGDRRLAAIQQASESRRQRIRALEDQARQMRNDMASQSMAHQGALDRLRSQNADAIAHVNDEYTVTINELKAAHQKLHREDSEKIHNQRRQLAEQERIHRQHGDEQRTMIDQLEADRRYIDELQYAFRILGLKVPLRREGPTTVTFTTDGAKTVRPGDTLSFGANAVTVDTPNPSPTDHFVPTPSYVEPNDGVKLPGLLGGLPVWGHRGTFLGYGRVRPEDGHIELVPDPR